MRLRVRQPATEYVTRGELHKEMKDVRSNIKGIKTDIEDIKTRLDAHDKTLASHTDRLEKIVSALNTTEQLDGPITTRS